MLNQPKFNLGPTDPGPNPLDAATPDLKKALETAKDILVLIRDNPRLDHVAAGLGLYLALKETGVSVTIASPTEMRVEFNRLVGVDKIATKIGNRNLVISLPQEIKDSIEKVSYNMDDGNFNLVIQPKAGYPPPDSSKVEYSYSGAQAQVVFIVGAQKLEDLGPFYQNERKLFEQATVINIDASPTNARFGNINLIWADFVSTSEIVTELIERIGLKLDQDSATNLLAGMNDSTQNFQRFNLKATAFEAAAKLMKAGGKRPAGIPAFGAPNMGGMSPFGNATMGARPLGMPGVFNNPFAPPQMNNPANPLGNPNQNADFNPAPYTPPSPMNNPAFSAPTPQATAPLPTNLSPQPTPNGSPFPSVFTEPPLYPSPQPMSPPQPSVQTQNFQPPQPNSQMQPEVNTTAATNDTGEDWLKPKIFTGSSKIS